ncbi:MAG TPA: UDP-glucose/GDP-mannose dehydrogenase family protein [Methanocorpusculum sp.]|nr:UDP-glucose/GDP-mannose dehydrogenase family protein [Methanocorpusculum sp.]HJK72903.1 UDP-glucose/GDP-mannose dehydrogenase family protein [Methanocorpusculum sp.]HJK83023.1 UDP-glucose/GDP-mannose dehydrogenase family protein [Methanocorpusculum sp.]
MHITIVGGGYVGLVTAACLSHLNHNTTVIEIFSEKVAAINRAESPIYEVGLDILLKTHISANLRATTQYTPIQTSDVIFIAVGTPPNPDGSANLSYITAAAEAIADELSKSHTEYPVIVVKSTVPPGTTKNLVEPIIRRKNPDLSFGICMNPEFLREGRAVEDFLHPDRIVVGSSDPETIRIMHELYTGITAPIIDVDPTAAEMIKYTSNALLATKISFANEIGNLCKQLGINVYEVMTGVGMDSRVSPKFLNAGCGFGGSCFPKDVSALASIAQEHGVTPTLLNAVLAVNDSQPLRMVELLETRIGSLLGKRIAVLGLAFKDNTDDVRESRSIPVIEALRRKGAVPVLFDPMAMDTMKAVFPDEEYAPSAATALTHADGCLVMTEWPEFAKLSSEFDAMRERVIIDGRHILTIDDAEGICW